MARSPLLAPSAISHPSQPMGVVIGEGSHRTRPAEINDDLGLARPFKRSHMGNAPMHLPNPPTDQVMNHDHLGVPPSFELLSGLCNGLGIANMNGIKACIGLEKMRTQVEMLKMEAMRKEAAHMEQLAQLSADCNQIMMSRNVAEGVLRRQLFQKEAILQETGRRLAEAHQRLAWVEQHVKARTQAEDKLATDRLVAELQAKYQQMKDEEVRQAYDEGFGDASQQFQLPPDNESSEESESDPDTSADNEVSPEPAFALEAAPDEVDDQADVLPADDITEPSLEETGGTAPARDHAGPSCP